MTNQSFKLRKSTPKKTWSTNFPVVISSGSPNDRQNEDPDHVRALDTGLDFWDGLAIYMDGWQPILVHGYC